MSQAPAHLDIAYRRSRRAKYLRISIDPSQAVTVTVPYQMPQRQVDEFVQSRQKWIENHLRRLREQEQKQKDLPELSDEELIQAQHDLFARLEHFSRIYELPYNRATFRCQKTRWGSCSNQNNISLNINLAFLPDHLQDYVLLHELTHICHKNHSKAFWRQLDQYCSGKAKQLAGELKSCPFKMQA